MGCDLPLNRGASQSSGVMCSEVKGQYHPHSGNRLALQPGMLYLGRWYQGNSQAISPQRLLLFLQIITASRATNQTQQVNAAET